MKISLFQIFFLPYNITHYSRHSFFDNSFYSRFFFFYLTILHITNCVLHIRLLFTTLQHYILLQIFLKKYFSTLQNYTLNQMWIFFENIFISDFFLPYNITHYSRVFFLIIHFILDFSFSTLQYYTLQTVFYLKTVTLTLNISWNLDN